MSKSNTIEPITFGYDVRICSSCTKKYNNNYTKDITYHGPKVARNICHSCHIKALDRMYGIDNKFNVDLEEELYKND